MCVRASSGFQTISFVWVAAECGGRAPVLEGRRPESPISLPMEDDVPHGPGPLALPSARFHQRP
jgi:hypothetical protein